jgi:hypothetical protein
MKRIIGAAMAALALSCAIGSANAATFKPINKGKSLVMTGEIVAGDVDRLHAAGKAAEKKYGRAVVERIFLNSPGGDAIAGMEIAEFVRAWGIDVVVGKTDECVSMCAVVFAAGQHKVVFTTSRLGVHAISAFAANADGTLGDDQGEDQGALALTTLVARAMAEWGVPANIVTAMMTTRQPDVYWITAEDGWSAVEVLR